MKALGPTHEHLLFKNPSWVVSTLMCGYVPQIIRPIKDELLAIRTLRQTMPVAMAEPRICIFLCLFSAETSICAMSMLTMAFIMALAYSFCIFKFVLKINYKLCGPPAF